MERAAIREQLYEKYIAPTKREREDCIGIEIEMPIVNLNREAVDFAVVHHVTELFLAHFHFQVSGRDEEGNIYALQDPETGDILSYDCSYNNLELSLGKERNLYIIRDRFHIYYQFLQEAFGRYHYTLTGMGVNPYRQYNRNVPIPNGRYRMLFHHLNSYKRYHLPMYFHEYPEYGTFSSASQVQLDVHYEELLTTLRAFSRLEPVKALLFSNSVLLGEHEDLLCCRDMFWENSTHGINGHNIGMMECEPESVEDLLSYIESTSMYCAERGEKYVNFPPIQVTEYFQRPTISGEYYEDGGYKSIDIHPEQGDLKYLRTFKFEDLTYRGTVEFRSVCCQPIKESMTVAAFHLGLKGKLEELDELLREDHAIYHHGYTAAELRKLFVQRQRPGFLDEKELYGLVFRILDLAEAGLKERGYGEERLLLPLYKRAEERSNPAEKMLTYLEQGVSLEQIIMEYGELTSD